MAQRLADEVGSILQERNLIDVPQCEDMCSVPSGPPVFGPEVAWILGSASCVSAIESSIGHVGQSLAPGVGGIEGKVPSCSIPESGLQRVVVGGSEIGTGAMAAAKPAPTDKRPGEVRRCEVAVEAGIEVESS